ncbi:GtrA family protein [Actinoallomurus bryophytorum]|uniref:Putative flippase GtrA n=1 Tax=Actinoallomurus bryophytorum TaxID=1490222 RepID=A0A543CUR8_9ACTN|nr:GtrA family protein [Actinoallomurus bryophytorum]TQM00843.1 putative flippase GtrA [Actinoallomurus bryophytorum]
MRHRRPPVAVVAVDLYRRFARLARELARFGTIGVLNFVITTGISDTLHLVLGVGPLTSVAVGTVVATTFSYFANRYWTFRHRDTSGLGREYVVFFVLNTVALVITWVFIGLTHYVLGLHDGIAYNGAQVVGTGAATVFRYWAYKRWVFLPESAPPADPHTGLPAATDTAEKGEDEEPVPPGVSASSGPAEQAR